MNKKVALVTGITGQDGAYLAEFLLKKGYIVHGLKRRSSLLNTERVDHLYSDPHEKDINFFLHYGDLTDSTNLIRLVQKIQPDEIYNLAAMSHVHVSFEMPEYTANADGLGTLRLLEAIRLLGMEKNTKFYQASTSELYGLVQEVPQSEKTPFYPRSPYAVAKLYAYWITVNYREAYDMYACNGVLFNHECISENTPLIVKINNIIDIKRIKDIKRAKEKGRNVQQWLIDDIKIWDGDDFVNLNCITATKRNKNNIDHLCKTVNTRHGIVETTNHHNLLNNLEEKVKAIDINQGDKLLHKILPTNENICSVTPEEAMFLGLMVADGSISNGNHGKFTNKSNEILEIVSRLWRKICLGSTVISSNSHEKCYGTSLQLRLNGGNNYLLKIDSEIYTYDRLKKVPERILNASNEIQLKFLEGYNLGDGLKKNNSNYNFKNFKTNSPILAQGLIFLINNTTKQDFNITFEYNDKYYGYYSINLLSDKDNKKNLDSIKKMLEENYSQRKISETLAISRLTVRKVENNEEVYKKSYLYKDRMEVKKTFYHSKQPDWVYDLETESGKFLAGVGNIVISNSPLRGETFVTRKITRAVSKIALGLQDKLYLGNLNAKRDWGHAKDYVEAMYLMLQQEKPEDFVIATGVTTQIRDFINLAFKEIGIEIEFKGEGVDEKGFIKSVDNSIFERFGVKGDHLKQGLEVIAIDPRYFRPTEVELLIGDPTKAKAKLGWEPKYDLKALVKEMVESDMELTKRDKYLSDGNYKILKNFE